MNYTVVDPTSVSRPISEIVKKHADELLTRDEVNNLLEQLKQKSPKLVEETVPAIVKPAELQKILQNLLRERVPDPGPGDDPRDARRLGAQDQGPRRAHRVRAQQPCAGPSAHQYTTPDDAGQPDCICVTLDPTMEDLINAYIDRGPAGTSVTMPARIAAARRRADLAKGLQLVTAAGHQPVVIASPQVRAVVRRSIEPHLPTVAVLGYNEITPGRRGRVARLGHAPAAGRAPARRRRLSIPHLRAPRDEPAFVPPCSTRR
jgi:flagellar biosynthesis protein FlhA